MYLKHSVKYNSFSFPHIPVDFTISPLRSRNQQEDSGLPLPVFALVIAPVGAVQLLGIAMVVVFCCYLSHRHRKMMAVFKV